MVRILCVCTFLLVSSLPGTAQQSTARTSEIEQLRQDLNRLSARLAVLEAAEAGNVAAEPTKPVPKNPSEVTTTSPAVAAVPTPETAPATFLRDTTLNFGLDGYYGYNFNRPLNGTNQVRAYDLSANSFSINQASLMVEHLPQPLAGKRFGGRLDLQFGQATETLQGNTANESNPEVWRNVFQAYGSYLAPIGGGLQIDFGKWSSALGVEGNYTKDQLNYSRSYLFDYLPFYHTGLRANISLTPRVNVAYWLVNGVQQTEDFNGFKSQAFILTLKPAKSVTWNVNYYFGEEQHDTANSPSGVLALTHADGREHIFDTYATWTPTSKLTVIGEADYVVNRVFSHSAPSHVAAGAAYLRYALPGSSAVATRLEYFSDRGGLFTGTTQALKEITLTFDHQFQPGFLARAEYRRDLSNTNYFLTNRPGVLNNAQGTATLGLIFWWGTKQGSW